MRNQKGDQDPKDGLHGPPAGVGVYKPEAKQPGGEQSASEEASESVEGYCPERAVVSGDRQYSHSQGYHSGCDDRDPRPKLDGLWHYLKKGTSVHKILSLRLDSSGNMGNSSKIKREGMIQKVSSPYCRCAW